MMLYQAHRAARGAPSLRSNPVPYVSSHLALPGHSRKISAFRFGFGHPRDDQGGGQKAQKRRSRSSWQAYMDSLNTANRKNASDAGAPPPMFRQVFNRRWFAFRTGCYAPGQSPDEFLRGAQRLHRQLCHIPSSVRLSSWLRQNDMAEGPKKQSGSRGEKGFRESHKKSRSFNESTKSDHSSEPRKTGSTQIGAVGAHPAHVKDPPAAQPPYRIEAYRIDPITNRKIPCYGYPAGDLETTPRNDVPQTRANPHLQDARRGDCAQVAPVVPFESEHGAGTFSSMESQAKIANSGPMNVDYALNHLPPDEPSESTDYSDVTNSHHRHHDAEQEIPTDSATAHATRESPDQPTQGSQKRTANFTSNTTTELNDSGSINPRQLHIDPQIFYDCTDRQPRSSADALGFDDLNRYNTCISLEEEPLSKQETPTLYADLHEYSTTPMDEPPADQEIQVLCGDLHDYAVNVADEQSPESETLPRYDDLDKYRSFDRSEEAVIGKSENEYDDLGQYEYKDANDLTTLAAESSAEKYDDLGQYEYKDTGDLTSVTAESTPEQYDDLSDYRADSFPDPFAPHRVKEFERRDEERELDDYEAARDRISARLQHVDLSRAPDFDNTRNDSMSPGLVETREQVEQSMDEFARGIIAGREAGDKSSSGNTDPADNSSALTGSYAKDFPEDFSRSWASEIEKARQELPPNTDPWGFDTTPKGLETDFQSEVTREASLSQALGSEPTRTSSTDEWGFDTTPRGLETDFETETANSKDTHPEPRTEVHRPLATKTDEWGFDTTPTGLETDFESEAVGDPKSSYQGRPVVWQRDFPKSEPAQKKAVDSLQPALERSFQKRLCIQSIKGRGLRKNQSDGYSKDPQGLETSFAEECIDDTEPPAFSRTYCEKVEGSARTTAKRDSGYAFDYGCAEPFYERDPEVDGILKPAGPATAEVEPTVYKILAYDPTMQTIDIAETTSIVPDQASPLPPTDVLLRLSNPTKFFPHFQPLREQGFEILSGGGDVLVFRRVRKAETPKKDSKPPVNPIDMMGSRPTALPNAAAFASPTGFVNYDVPEVDGSTGRPSSFKSNIDVRREEPVFSATRPKASDAPPGRGGKRRRSIAGKMLMGGAWAAGVTYALGVVGEYFTTGGSDGQGPRGL